VAADGGLDAQRVEAEEAVTPRLARRAVEESEATA
jgi:hypothetical protein